MVSKLTTIVLGEKDFKLEEVEKLFKSCFRLMKCPRFERVETFGFGNSLLEKWIEASKIREKPEPKSGGFYSKPELKLGSSHSQSQYPMTKNKVMFDRVKVLGDISTNVLKTVKSCKRKVDTEENIDTKKVKLTPSAASVAVGIEFEQSLLSLYM